MHEIHEFELLIETNFQSMILAVISAALIPIYCIAVNPWEITLTFIARQMTLELTMRRKSLFLSQHKILQLIT